MNRPHRVLLGISIFFVSVIASPLTAQVTEDDAIAELQSLGGRVITIAADTTDREISLYLAGDAISDQQLPLLKSVSDVKWLNLANTSVTDQGLAHLHDLKLTRLHLEKTTVGDKGLAHLKNQTDLQYLNLYGTKVSNEGLKHLAELSKLRKLYVWQTAVDQDGIQWLTERIPELEIVGAVQLQTEPEKGEVEPNKDTSDSQADPNKKSGK